MESDVSALLKAGGISWCALQWWWHVEGQEVTPREQGSFSVAVAGGRAPVAL